MKTVRIIVGSFLITISQIFAQGNTVGLFLKTADVADGYTLFAPMKSTITYLIDNNGEMVHSWSSDGMPGLSVYLLPDGNLLRTQSVMNTTFNAGGGGGKVVELDWEGNKVWEFTYSSSSYRLHHDIEYLPNGNILMIAWASKNKDEALDAGRKPELIYNNAVWYTLIIEVEQAGSNSGNIVWEWNAWDHIIQDYDSSKPNYGFISEHPELMDLNFIENPTVPNNSSDWLHTNSIDYNEELDQILLSVRGISEIWIIDHSTTTEEASGYTGGRYGKGGDILYRWGNPRVYGRGTEDGRTLFYQHDAEWIPSGYPGEGNITMFNNGDIRVRNYSTADEIELPYDESGNYLINESEAYEPDNFVWSYSDNPSQDFFAENISGVQRLINGNTLICSGPFGDFFEVNSSGAMVWEYVNPVTGYGALTQGEQIPTGNMGQENTVFRAKKYSPEYSAFAGKDLTPKGKIEIYPTSMNVGEELPQTINLHQNYPNPFNPTTKIKYSVPEVVNANSASQSKINLTVFDILGREVAVLVNEYKPAGNYEVEFNAENLSSGIYFYGLRTLGFTETKKMILLR